MGSSYTVFKTRWGWMGVSYTEKGLLALTLPKESVEEAVRSLEQESKGPLKPGNGPRKRLQKKFETYFSGKPVTFDEPLDLERATPFQREVWKALQAIPWGRLRSYKEIAEAIGRPTAPRAVGQAVGSNPLPIIIPCHRVIAHDGSLGGYAAGLGWKKKLLALERGSLPGSLLRKGEG